VSRRIDIVYYPWVDRYYEPTGPDGEDTEGTTATQFVPLPTASHQYLTPTMHDDFPTPDITTWRQHIRPAILRQDRPQL
jgi:hypothetical protein